MDGSSSTTSAKGSTGIFTGTFSPVVYVEHILNEYPKALNKALKEQAERHQKALQQQATDIGGKWGELSSNIRVDYNNTTGVYNYYLEGEDNIQREAMALEYGTFSQAPTPLIRTNILEHQDGAANDISKNINMGISKGY